MPTGFLEFHVEGMDYVVYVPREGQAPYPTILFLHGMGESGSDGLKQVIQGIGSAIQWNRARWPFLVILPQKPDANKLWPEYKAELNAILHQVEGDFEIDDHRRTITGLSQGGHGTFNLAGSLAWSFAAAAPICGWCDDEAALERLKEIPLWAFHGSADQAVPVQRSEEAVAKLKAMGADAKLTVYEGVDHNSWDRTYRESDLPKWLADHNTL
jgi:predicted peptidase